MLADLQELRTKRMSTAAQVQYRGQDFDTYIVDIEKSDLRLFLQDSVGQGLQDLEALRSHVEADGGRLVFATNAGMFAPDHQPVGLYIENGKELHPLDLQEGEGNFYMKPNGVFSIGKSGAHIMESEQFATTGDSSFFATQSGPALLLNDTIHPAFRAGSANTYIRSGVGILSSQKIVLAISVAPVNFFDFAMLFKEYFGCSDALYLDGAISEMFLPALNRMEMNGKFGPFIGIVE
ncbi:MAG: phosphodiester glycosidase family protein [Bacteroidota bacterium]